LSTGFLFYKISYYTVSLYRFWARFYYLHSGSNATFKKCCNLHRLASEIFYLHSGSNKWHRGGSGAIGLHGHL